MSDVPWDTTQEVLDLRSQIADLTAQLAQMDQQRELQQIRAQHAEQREAVVRTQLAQSQAAGDAVSRLYTAALRRLTRLEQVTKMSLALDTELDQAGARLCKRIEDQEQQLAQVTAERDEAMSGCAIAAKGIVNLDTKLAERDAELARAVEKNTKMFEASIKLAEIWSRKESFGPLG